jgi:hypothetical protein
MMVFMKQKNYDSANHLYWFRKVKQHPDLEAQSLAEAFCKRISSELGIPAPRVFWFEETECRQASMVWMQNPSKKDQAADPLREPCEYFRWRGRPAWVFCGYTHRESPLGIMINVCRSGEDLLETIAEECFHIYQDFLHGVGWRAVASYDAVEGEAREFVRSKTDDIRNFPMRRKERRIGPSA